LRESEPALAAALESEALRLGPLLERMKAAQLRARNEALLTIVADVAKRYRRAKDRRGALDYDDLIGKTLAMLERMPGSWVHYKLDRGIDHVLIDEAQDTSPQQWEIVTRLVGEFFSGEGAREGTMRTLFAVGDEKQSIFSFQGAVMREFDFRRSGFAKSFGDAELTFKSVNFNYSFRSGAGVLKAVDATFRNAEIFSSITSDKDGMARHIELPDASPGTVDLWELEEPDDRQDIEGWRAPFDAKPETSPQVKLARRVARDIAGMIGRDSILRDGVPQPVSAGDILILVRRRGELFESVIQALKQAHVEVAGADRLKLTEHIAVIDLMALADALLLQRDDLSLAIALKSPLFGLNDDHLMTLAPGRAGTLREALFAQRDVAPYDAAWARLEACERRAHEKPFSFYAWLLGGAEGRARILRRLGPEANDALDEFLELALSYEQREAATLQGFMNWLRAADIEIKRDMDVARPEVRVMTVHGAKGLEAPIVYLADTTMPPRSRDSLIRIAQPDAPDGTKPCTIWAGSKKGDTALFATAREAATQETKDEYRRLLYVAMTRAAQRLVIAGYRPGNSNEIDPHSWYALMRDGLEASDLDAQTLETDDGPVRRFRKVGDKDLPQVAAAEAAPPANDNPPWLRQRAKAETEPRRWERPSDGEDGATHESATPSQDFRAQAARRGTLVHRLLQSLPDVAADHRASAAATFLARNAADWPQAEREALEARVLELLADSRFANLFAGDSRAEVPLVGTLTQKGGEIVNISGQIDRLIVTDDTILIADFKTNRVPPRTPDAIPPAYLRQMTLYRALLKKLYPQRSVRAVLIWTETPEIMEISEAALEAELTRITT
jgi:ATP-dependent helicase/nuclease subunit A